MPTGARSRAIVFESAAFNLSEVGAHFINPCCFGEDLARWLAAQLAARGVAVIEPDQEDWGWYVEASYGDRSYFIGIGGFREESEGGASGAAGVNEEPNRGEWRLIVEPQQTLRQRLFRPVTLADDDPFIALLLEILQDDRFERVSVEPAPGAG